ncbi:MAG: ATP synthase F1 subunit epsilon [Bacteroidota bacterium]|nr:ATP synthase F1 subunit epsilon [Bacteroidota bacterium]
MHLEIITPEDTLFTGEVNSVTLPGTAGQFQVLQNHAPLISTLDAGHIKFKKTDGVTDEININAGFVEVLNNKVTVLV